MSFDYNAYTSGDYVKFAEVGDAVVGIVKHVQEGKDFNGNPCPVLILEVDERGTEKNLTAGQALLKVALAEKKPQVGDKVRITYSGNTTNATPGRAPAKEFTVEVQQGPFALAQPQPGGADEAPF